MFSLEEYKIVDVRLTATEKFPIDFKINNIFKYPEELEEIYILE